MKVVKFGGSSLADGNQLQKVIDIIKSDDERKVIVVSAPGKWQDDQEKITDLLVKYAELAVQDVHDTAEIRESIKNRYWRIASHFGLETCELWELYGEIDSLEKRHYPSFEHLFAAFKAHGELLNATLVAQILQKVGILAKAVHPEDLGLIVTDEPNNATISESSYSKIRAYGKKNGIGTGEMRYIVPGFFGTTADGEIATFSRGGSDITGAILAKGLGADLYENFTDVDAIYAADPRIIHNPKPISVMTYHEMRELSYAGFSVFHDEAIIPAIEANIKIHILNTNNPHAAGTLIVSGDDIKNPSLITGIASSKRFAALYLHRYLLNRQVGFTYQLLKILNRHGISYEHMPSGIDDITIIFDKTVLPEGSVEKAILDIKAKIKPDILTWIDDYAIIMVVGTGMHGVPGVFQKIVEPVAMANISLEMVNQGSSEISIMLGVNVKDVDRAVKAIYEYNFK